MLNTSTIIKKKSFKIPDIQNLVDKLFGCMDIDAKLRNISVLADIGGGGGGTWSTK